MLRPFIVVGTVPCKLFVLIALQLCSVGGWTHVVRAVGAAAQVTAASKMRATVHLIAHEPKAVTAVCHSGVKYIICLVCRTYSLVNLVSLAMLDGIVPFKPFEDKSLCTQHLSSC